MTVECINCRAEMSDCDEDWIGVHYYDIDGTIICDDCIREYQKVLCPPGYYDKDEPKLHRSDYQ